MGAWAKVIPIAKRLLKNCFAADPDNRTGAVECAVLSEWRLREAAHQALFAEDSERYSIAPKKYRAQRPTAEKRAQASNVQLFARSPLNVQRPPRRRLAEGGLSVEC
jgi:hypothetical protein